MTSNGECAVLDLSKKSSSPRHLKTESSRHSPTYEPKYSKESLNYSVPSQTTVRHDCRQYESSALINTPPHESEVSAMKSMQETAYNIPSQFCSNVEIMNYSKMQRESQKTTAHLDTTLYPTYIPQLSPLLTPNPPNMVPWCQPLMSLPTPREIHTNPVPTQISPVSLPSQTSNFNQAVHLHNKAQQKKLNRPFKVYPNIPQFGNDNIDHIMKELSEERYEEYRDRILKNVERVNNQGTNIKMRRDNKNCTPTSTMQDKDEAYLEKRKKNNAAAKKSRDARKRKEDEIAIRAAYLESKIAWLMQLVKKLKEENNSLRPYKEIALNMNKKTPNSL